MNGRMILVTGWARTPTALQPLADALAPSLSCTVTSPDRLLDIAAAAGATGEATYSDGLIELIRREDEGTVVAGWSMGGLIALEAATRAPGVTDAVALIGSTTRFTSAPDYPCGQDTAIVRAMKQALSRDPRRTMSEFLSLVYAPNALPAGDLEGLVAEALDIDLNVLQHGLDYLCEADLRAAALDLDLTIGIFHGDADQIIPAAAATYFAERSSRAQLTVLEGCGHAFPVTNPDRLAAHILEWVGRA